MAKLSDRSHPLYDDNVNLWELYQDAAKGGDDFITDDNLFSHRLEDSTDFSFSLSRAYFLNLCDLLPSILNNYIFKSNIERAPTSDLARFRLNADNRGTNISDFVKRAGYFASVFGVIHAMVDVPPSPKKRLSKAVAKKLNLYPYASLIFPTQLVDWSLDSEGNFRWVIIESTYYRDLDPTKDREVETHYKLITTDSWEIQDEDGQLVQFDDGRPAKGKNALGIVPIATMYNGSNYGDNKVGESLIKDIVYVNREIMNFCSLISESIARQAFSQLVVPDNGSLSEAAESGSNPLIQLGTSSVWTFDSESSHPPQYISPDSEIIHTVWKLVQDLVKECFRLANLTGGTSDLYSSRSGRQSQMSFTSVNAALSNKSASYEKFENDLSRLALLQLNKDPETLEEVKYPSSFDILALEDELNNYMTVMERNFSPLLNKTLQKNIVRKMITTTPQNIRSEIETEIDNSDGIVEPLNKIDKKYFDEGEGNPNSNLEKNVYKTTMDNEKEQSSHRTVE